ncbi:protein FAR1-RELATED SEQUENCE 1-like [Chenopodium quinoa]|uniref:protein FAR1-RELATED SEQUENCE 1-like n=1 Tax=Chenopodium quinoa TaxID=63459 RepID=UPI000B78685A|nr:protein FAR1-RELATED SEQUENCE 1-like [Chenopodium quinoa]
MRKVLKKVGTTFCNDTEFLKELCDVVWDREIEPNEFVDGWNTVMEKYDLVAYEWFSYMFKIKHLWIPAYFRDLFMGECEAACFSYGVESCNSTYGDGVEFSIVVDNECQRNFDVTFDLSTLECTCTCKMFKSQGVLCGHILFIMKGKSISEILEHYVLNRWRKDVKKKPTSVDEASNFDKNKQLITDVWLKMFSCVYVSKKAKKLIQLFVRSNVVDVDILTPNQCLNKRSARSSKHLKSAKDVAAEEESKKIRTCRACGL